MSKCNAKILLKQNNLKMTHQRVLLLETIIYSEKVFSALDLENKVKNAMDSATIYRILSIFLENKIIREVVSNNVTRFYELACKHNPVHPHFVCRKCDKIICLEAIDDEYVEKLKNNTGDNLTEDIVIQFTGICSKCK